MSELSVHAGATETPLPADFRWPGGKRLAVFFRCAFEGWSDGHWPGVGPMGNPLKPGVPDLNAIGLRSTAIGAGSSACSIRSRARTSRRP
jgi:hypothetical protein